MSKLKKLNKKHKRALSKVGDIEKEIHETLSLMVAERTKVRLSKELVKWYEEYGEECGVPYNKLNAIKERPEGVIEDFIISDEVNIKVRFDLPDLDYLRVGIGDIE